MTTTINIGGLLVSLDTLRDDVDAAHAHGLGGRWAFTPETVAALLDEVERLQAERADDGARWAAIHTEMAGRNAALREQLEDVTRWYMSLFNDVTNTAPDYADNCGDYNAVLYLTSEVERIRATPPEANMSASRAPKGVER